MGATAGSVACVTGGVTPTPDCPQEKIAKTSKTIDNELIKPGLQVALLSALLNLWTFAMDKLAYEAALYIANGGVAQESMFYGKTAEEAWTSYGLDVAGDAIGRLSTLVGDELDTSFNLCAPGADLFKLSIQLGLKQAYKPTKPTCDFREITSNWNSFLTTTLQTASNPSQKVLQEFAKGFKPGQNELSAAIGINIQVHQKVLETKSNKLFEQLTSDGFKNVTDVITGQVKTPASVLNSNFEEALKDKSEAPEKHLQTAISNPNLIWATFGQVAGVFVNTLLSQLMNKVYTGLFPVLPTDADPFDVETIATVDQETAENAFSGFFTTSPLSISNYNILAEFVACPSGGVAVRNINNCVTDSNMAAAVARAEGGVPLTVQEAIDEGLLNGGWSLIPATDVSKNQDPLCYTYGYCYGNLVKLRKARILPVGWEIAASRNTGSTQATLQEIIDGFDDCDENGMLGTGAHKWCHLVDPNWVLKYPETQCDAFVNGELTVSTLSGGRAGACADMPSCISENNDGTCDGGFGYCVQEKNSWRFRGDECPEQYASCLAFENTDTNEQTAYMLNTVDFGVCTADNAGCLWSRTNKYFDDQGTEDTEDDEYEWLPGTETYTTADRENDLKYYDGAANSDRVEYGYDYGDEDDGTTGYDATYAKYAYEDRVYFNNNVEECTEDSAGCTELYAIGDDLSLNLVANSSFEEDEDQDGIPDSWSGIVAADYETDGSSYYGTDNVILTSSSTTVSQEDIHLAAGAFYTLSFYAEGTASGAATSFHIDFEDADDPTGTSVDLSGTSSAGDCTLSGTDGYLITATSSSDTPLAVDEWSRYTCTFTTLDRPLTATLWATATTTRLDAIQLELGDDASSYTEGYSTTSPDTAYLLLPPAYLGCSGDETDPAACDDYAQVCTAQDVGCNLYTPENGDPSIPAIAGTLDECPSECVGYETYKQEATTYEAESFPLYFIADNATTCSEQYVGCDEYTNLDSSEEGGEGIEYFTWLSLCMKPEMADDTDSTKTSSTFYTWEGSDAAGYQLVTWELLESDLPDSSTLSYSESSSTVVNDSKAGLGPCTHSSVTDASTVICDEESWVDPDDGTTWPQALEANDDCNEHDDILENPNCREFFDTAGNIHYRDYTLAVTVDSSCHPYRKTDTTEDDCDLSGGYWTSGGECRYFALPEDSAECPASASGCRSYTGGAGRNATTVYEDQVEDGSLTEYGVSTGSTLAVSNESVATGGHSMRLVLAAGGSLSTYQAFLDWTASSTYDYVYDSASPGTCNDGSSSTTWDNGHTETTAGCEIDGDNDGTVDCTVDEGDNNCGTLDGELVAGKTYMVNFWAKGSGNLGVSFNMRGGTGTAYDVVDPTDSDLDSIALDGSWQLYQLGPFDTSDISNFDDSALLVLFNQDSSDLTFYVDNISIKEVEENVTVVKNSWVVPSTCDQTPEGASSPQYYLGCEAYTDQDGNDATLYQFSDLCSEEVVGCEAYYDTQNSDSTYGAAYNIRCVYDTDSDFSTEEMVSGNQACEIDGTEYCTISTGRSYCTFDVEGNLPSPLPADAGNNYFVVLGPEAVIVENDSPVFVVDNGSMTCSAENAGCEEVGVPTYVQDKSEVESFESAYYINDPDSYGDILCDNEELFCAEWSSTQDGNFYFKDPGDQTCTYESNVSIDGVEYFGWFKDGTDEPCYDDYIIGGDEAGLWRNGDDGYDGWVGACGQAYDLCTEFVDTVDTADGIYPFGTSYYFTDNDTLSEDGLSSSETCSGQASQKEGCALFNDTNDSELTYATDVTYVSSNHADELFGSAPFALVDPISCNDGGEDISTSSGDTVNLCEMRCRYEMGTGNDLVVGNSVESGLAANILSNGGFETADGSGVADWTITSDVSRTTTVAASGSASLFFEEGGLTMDGTVSASGGEDYTFTYYAYVPDEGEFTSYLYVYDSSGATVDLSDVEVTGDCRASASGYFSTYFEELDSTTDFEAVTCSFTAPSDAASFDVRFSNASGETYIDKVTLSSGADSDTEYAGACFSDMDCSVMQGEDGEDYSGTCVNVNDLDEDGETTDDGDTDPTDDADPTAVFENDANRVLKVYRDRECAAWLSCSSSQVSWNSRTQKWETICDNVGLCTRYTTTGDSSFCTQWEEADPIKFDAMEYANRDVAWGGAEYAGYAIPDQLPIATYSQELVSPDADGKICTDDDHSASDTSAIPYLDENGAFESCEDDETACASLIGFTVCHDAFVDDYRLAYDAGPCDMLEVDWGGTCSAGYCQATGDSCGSDGDCGTGDVCVIGYCQAEDPSDTDGCGSDDECTNSSYPVCDTISGHCVDHLKQDGDICASASDCSSGSDCIPADVSKIGMCLNNRCLTDITGDAFTDAETLEDESCRGYPEVTSPFPAQIVSSWNIIEDANGDGEIDTSTEIDQQSYSEDGDGNALYTNGWSTPYEFVSGFGQVDVCAPDLLTGVVSDECLCSYNKVTYGTGVSTRYYSIDDARSDYLEGICAGGSLTGLTCSSDDDCNGGTSATTGTCQFLTKKEAMYGWDGYCLERDSSINLYGTTDEQACLTWLPVDQLSGSTDLYGKHMEAGYPLVNTYFCSEVGYYVDLYPTGAEDSDGDGDIDDIDMACATGDNSFLGSCNFEEYGADDACVDNVVCPEGFVGILGYCDNNTDGSEVADGGNVCKDGTADSDVDNGKSFDAAGITDSYDDCPFFCIPDNSYHTQDGNGDAGEKCVDTSDGTGELYDPVQTGDPDYGHEVNGKGVTVFKAGNLYAANWSAYNDAADSNDVDKFKDCAVRGLPLDTSAELDGVTYDLDWYNGASQSGSTYVGFSSGGYAFGSGTTGASYGVAHRAVGGEVAYCGSTGFICDSDADCALDWDDTGDIAADCAAYCGALGGVYGSVATGGLGALSAFSCEVACIAVGVVTYDPVCHLVGESNVTTGNIRPYLGCYEIAQTTTEDGELDSGTYNKAWTNRTLYSSYSLVEDNGFAYTRSTTPTVAGAVPFDSYFSQDLSDEDVWNTEGSLVDAIPIPSFACSTGTDTGGIVGIYTDTLSCTEYDDIPGAAGYNETDLPKPYEDLDVEGGTGDEVDAWSGTFGDDMGEYGDSDSDDDPGTSVTENLSQFFSEALRRFRYNWENNTYELVDEVWDGADTGDTNPGTGAPDQFAYPHAPVVMSVGDCTGTNCEEGVEGTFDLNNADSGVVAGGEGRLHATASFFAYAQPNQMPIRAIIVDWGDSSSWSDPNANPWPTDNSQSGSNAENNFYKNHRGFTPEGDSNCDVDTDGWGGTPSACETSYITFTNDYTCSDSMVSNLASGGRTCEVDEDTGRLIYSPCTGSASGIIEGGDGACVFQPRVHVKDNWGWCTGECDSGLSSSGGDGTDECYQGSPSAVDECDITHCPSEGEDSECPDAYGGTIDNPWVNFDGYIVVTP